ncbi:MAG: hypothetical protein RJQ01_00280 [Microcella sp.]|uniref:hypothetical protein n=1 Tax=Microcella sp. TaxID=1913979 RepID=UPI003315B50E
MTESLTLTAGDLTMEWDGFALRRIRRGDAELVRRVTVAVRNLDWATIAPSIEGLHVESEADSFSITFTATHELESTRFTWRGTVTGTNDGSLSYDMRGGAPDSFEYNRIGLVVSLPADHAGYPYRASWEGAESSAGSLPSLVAPQLWIDGTVYGAITHFDAFEVSAATGDTYRLSFEGEEFELEDQRNWADGSFKIYSTPLQLGWPHTAEPGQEFHQRVTVNVTSPGRDASDARPAEAAARAERRGWRAGEDFEMPAIGVRAGGLEGDRPSEAQFSPQYVRVDVDCTASPFHAPALPQVAEGRGVELAMVVDAQSLAHCESVISQLQAETALARIIVIVDGLDIPSRDLIESIAGMASGVPVFASTRGNFAELNRRAPDLGAGAGVAIPFTPTFHDVDEQSILEGLEALSAVVHSGRDISSGRVSIGALSLRPYSHLLAREWSVEDQTDDRIDSLFAAAWFVAAVARLGEAGAESVTAFSVTGPHGLWGEDGEARRIAAVHGTLSSLAGRRAVRISTASAPVDGIEVATEEGSVVVLVNLSPSAVEVPWERGEFAEWRLSSTPRGPGGMVDGDGSVVVADRLLLEPWETIVLRERG